MPRFTSFFCEFRVLELLAYSHALARSYQLRKIGIKRMVREPGKFDILRHAVGTARERDAEYLGGDDGIVGKCLVEVADAKQ